MLRAFIAPFPFMLPRKKAATRRLQQATHYLRLLADKASAPIQDQATMLSGNDHSDTSKVKDGTVVALATPTDDGVSVFG
jgi:hypothetical protein